MNAGYLLKIKSYEEQITEAKNQTTTVEELDRLQNDLENELANEKLLLDDLR